MALSGVEIFKHLPKTNCKKCGFPTCLAFAMKLAAKQASLDLCPDASEEAKAFLGAASEPPIRPITIGAGDKALKVGEETVLFRHEKKFVHPCGFALLIKDTEAGSDIEAKAAAVASSEIERVGQRAHAEEHSPLVGAKVIGLNGRLDSTVRELSVCANRFEEEPSLDEAFSTWRFTRRCGTRERCRRSARGVVLRDGRGG